MVRCLLLDVFADCELVPVDELELELVLELVLELQAASMSAAAARAAPRCQYRGLTGMDGTARLLVPARRVFR
jgi:hypothetical protein